MSHDCCNDAIRKVLNLKNWPSFCNSNVIVFQIETFPNINNDIVSIKEKPNKIYLNTGISVFYNLMILWFKYDLNTIKTHN